MTRKKFTLAGIFIITIGLGALLYLYMFPLGDCVRGKGDKHCAEEYIDLSVEEAYKEAQKDGLTPKTRSIDGSSDVINTDLGGQAVYFTVNDNKVTKVEFE